jgi:hypothetical protein
MYLATRQCTIGRRAGGYRRARRLGDSCYLDAITNARVCVAGDPTGQNTPASAAATCKTAGPINQAASSALAPDKTTWQFTAAGSTLIGVGKNNTQWTYSFMHHAGTSDVYQRVGGPKCGKFNCDYILVSSSGTISFISTAPAKDDSACVAALTTGSLTTPSTAQTSAAAAGVYPVVSPSVGWTQNQAYANSPYVQTPVGTPVPESSGFSLSKIPTWALLGGGIAAGIFGMKLLGKR